jgi:hypothetical protein
MRENDPIETNQQQRYSRMDRESKVVSLSSNEVQMVPILTRLVGDKVATRKNCLCIVRQLVNCNSNVRGFVWLG